MNRENAKQKLIDLGVAEPTEEQISNLLNTVGAETKREKDRADGYKKDADKALELQKQLDAINEQNMTDLDKANKATETANGRIADLEKQLTEMRLITDLAKRGIVGDDATNIVGAISKGDFSAMTAIFGDIITARETLSANAKEQELLKNTPNPSGGQNGADGKSNAERIVANLYGNKNDNGATNILSHYTNN